MMDDGHSGVGNREVNRAGSPQFSLALSFLEDSSREKYFVIHASSSVFNISGGLSPYDFLQRVGYQHFQGNCPFHQDRCFYRYLARFEEDPQRDFFQADRFHSLFRQHAEALPSMYDGYRAIVDKLRVSRDDELDLFPELRRSVVPLIKADPNAVPAWVVSEMPSRFGEVLKSIQSLQVEEEHLRSIAGLLWQTGDSLEVAVRDAFRDLGYSAELTKKGETYDIDVQLEGEKRLLIEATGISGPLKKDTAKFGQALQAFQKATPQDRVVIALNHYREKTLSERRELDAITPDALGPLKGLGVNVLTTPLLFQIWKESAADPEAAKQRIVALHAVGGGLFSLEEVKAAVSAAAA